MNNFVKLIVFKYIKNFFDKKNNSIPGIISIASIAISVFSLIVVLSVMKGFEVKVTEKVINSFPHIVIKESGELNLKNIPGIKSYNKTSEDYGAVLVNDNFNILQIKGLDHSSKFPFLKSSIIDGKYYPIILDKNLSIKLSIKEQSKIKILAADFSGNKPKIKEIDSYVFKVIDLDLEFDRVYMFNDHKKKLGLTKDNFKEILLLNPYESKSIQKKIIDKYPDLKFKIIDWQTLNSSLFNLIKLERLAIGLFLMFLIILSATNIYSNIVSFILDKKNEIGTLILIGASKRSLTLIFTTIGLFIGIVGTFIGALLSFIVIFVIINTDIINILGLDISFYRIDGFPIIFSIQYFLLISFLSISAVIISSFIPSYIILNKDLETLIRRDY